MLEDAFWTTIYTDDQIRLIEEHNELDQVVQNIIQELVELATE